jgi:tetratricopeptide (TPR) repeat protein
MDNSKKIEFQLSDLDDQLFQNSERIIRVKITPDSGIREEIRVTDDGVTLDCEMRWNTGLFWYDIPANSLLTLLRSKPFDEISSENLNEFQFELIDIKDGVLEHRKVNEIAIDKVNEVIESLKGTTYEVDTEEDDNIRRDIEEKMDILYNNGVISDSEYTFSSLFSLEFNDDIKGYYYIDDNYLSNVYDKADILFKDGDYAETIKLLKKYIAFENNKEGVISGLTLIADSYEELKDFENAIIFHDKVIKLEPTSEYSYTRKGMCLKKNKEYKEAIDAFGEAVILNSQNITATVHLAECYLLTNNEEEALEVLDKGIESNPTQPPNTLSIQWLFKLKAGVLKSQGKLSDAIDFYEFAININEDAWCYRQMGLCQQDIQDFTNALFSYEKAIEIDENINDAYMKHNMGECHRRSGRYLEAIEFFKSSIEENNENILTESFRCIGIAYLETKQYKKAIESLKKAVPSKYVFQFLGKSYFGLAEYESALNEFDKVIEKDPTNYKWGYHERGRTHERLGNDQLALDDFDKVIQLDPKYLWAYHEKGKVYAKLNDHDSAIACFEKVIEIDSGFNWVYYDIALSYHAKGLYAKAIEFYDKCRVERNNLVFHYNIIAAKNNSSPYAKNEENLLEEGLDNYLLQALLERGKLEHYDSEGAFDPEFSLNDLDKLIALDPNYYQAYYHRARIYLNKDYGKVYSIEKGTQDLQSCLEIKRYGPALLRYSEVISDFEKKTALIKEAVELMPNDSKAWLRYGEVLYKKKEYEEALEKFKKSNELKSNGWILQKIAKTHASLKSFTQAIDYYNKAIELVDWYENWMCELSEVYTETKQFDEAESSILRALNHRPKEKYYRQLHKILSLRYTSDEHKTVLSDISSFIDSCNLDCDRNSEKMSDIEYLKNYEENLLTEDESIFSFLKFLNNDTLNHFIENGRYATKIHLLKNQSLDISVDQIKKIISESNYTLVETAISNSLLSTEMLGDIIRESDNTYLYSYKLLGVCSNPNVTEEQLEKLKHNKFNWVKQKAYSVTKVFNNIDTSDRYVLLGLINNPNINSQEHNYKELLDSTTPSYFKYKLDGKRVGIEEYNVGSIPEEDVYEGFLEVAPLDENWSDYIQNDWYNYGESEYGVTTYIDEIEVWSDEESTITIPSGISQIQTWPENEDSNSAPIGEFVQIVTSGEKGEWNYHEFEIENEFRPENLYPIYTDYKRLIEGYRYVLDSGDEIDIEGELSESRGSHLDIELYLGTESGNLWIDFEDIKCEMEDQNLNPDNIDDVKQYFQKLSKQ